MSDLLTSSLQHLKEFAQKNKDVECLISHGSSITKTFDKYSDLDLFLFTSAPEKYLDENDGSWISQLGEVLIRVVETHKRESDISINKIILTNGLCIDFIIINAKKFKRLNHFFAFKKRGMENLFPSRIINGINRAIDDFDTTLRRGYNVIHGNAVFNKIFENIMQHCENNVKYEISPAKFAKNHASFWQICHKMSVKLIRNEFYYVSVKLIRNEFYYVSVILHGSIKKQLLEMIEWHTLSNGKKIDIVSNGLYIAKWADPLIVEELYSTFPHSNTTEMRKSIINIINLYQRLSHEVAIRNGYSINQAIEQYVIKFIQQENKTN
jgi:hypothetical protein